MGPARAPRAARLHSGPLPVGTGTVGLGELLLRRGRPSGHAQLEGLLLRLLRRLELHHRRQDPRRAVGDGHLCPGVRTELVEPSRAAGADGRGHRRPALRGRASLVGTGGRPDRRDRLRLHSGRGVDVPVRQPRCTPDAVVGRRRLRDDARHRGRQDPVVADSRNAGRFRLSHQDAAGVHRIAGLRTRLPDRRQAPVAAPARPVGRRGIDRARLGRLVGRDRGTRPRFGPAVHRRIDDQQHPATDVRLQRAGPHHRQRGRGRGRGRGQWRRRARLQRRLEHRAPVRGRRWVDRSAG